jgi:hypothetical protein
MEREKKQCNKNPDIAMCEISIESEPSDQDVIWTVDPTSLRSFVDRDLEVTRTLNIRNSKSRYAKSRNDLNRQIKC